MYIGSKPPLQRIDLPVRTSTAPIAKEKLPDATQGLRQNWNGKITVKPTKFYAPTTEDEVAAIMKHEKRVRVGGAFHSFTEALVPAPGGAFIDMTRMRRVETPKRHADGSYSVRVQAGATIRELSAALAAHGLALENLPASAKITVGGAIANGVHGSGLTSRAVLAEQVIGMSIVTSDGEKREVASADLPLYRINLGLLGVVTSVELRCVPDFDMVQADDIITGEEAITAALEPSRLRADLTAVQSTTYVMNPNLADPSATQLTRWRLLKVTDANRAEIEAKNLPRKEDYDEPSAARRFFYDQTFAAAAAAGNSWLGRQLNDQIRASIAKPQEERIGRSALMYHWWGEMPVHDYSYGIPLERAQEAFTRVMAMMREQGYVTPIPLSMRFLKGSDETLIGMNSGRDVAVFELMTSVMFDDAYTGKLRPDVQAAQDAFEKIMVEMGGRAHWGKNSTVNGRDRHSPSAWQRFAEERDRVGTKLDNAWARKFAPRR